MLKGAKMMQPLPKVAVLLSTFNGENYLRELTASVLAQEGVEVLLMVRDDGSTDGTLGILSALQAENDRVTVIFGTNIGVNRSFFTLLGMDIDADYFAFCDQDDVWLPGKLESALEFLVRFDRAVPALYGCSAILVDSELMPIRAARPLKIAPSFENALIENILQGSTQVLNRASRDLVLASGPPANFMYDWWTYLVVSSSGSIKRDATPYILYRQHAANVIGSAGGLELWRRRFANHVRGGQSAVIAAQAKEARRRLYNRMNHQSRAYLDAFIDSRDIVLERLKFAITGRFPRSRRIDGVILRVLYGLGYI